MSFYILAEIRTFPNIRLFFTSFFCIIYQGLQSQNDNSKNLPEEKVKLQTFYLIGALGEKFSRESNSSTAALQAYLNSKENKRDEEKSFLLFLGDNVDQKLEVSWKDELEEINQFSGEVVFVPGENEWAKGINGLKVVKGVLRIN